MNSDSRKIPIVIGISGHRQIRDQDREILFSAVKNELEKLRGLCPDSPLLMLCSLAEGADLICADAASELGIPLAAVLPFEAENYEKDFSSEAKPVFATHCSKATQLFIAPHTEPVPASGVDKDYLYRQAGIYVVSHCHILIALWDGGPGTQAACGTAESVDFALNGSYYPSSGVSLRSDSNEAVIHIFTPRGERSSSAAGTVSVLGNWVAVRHVLERTDEFNRLASVLPKAERTLLPNDRPEDPVLLRMEDIYTASGELSRSSAVKFRTVLALLAIASTVLTMGFLLYDEAEAIWMIFVCGAMILAAWGCRCYAVRSDCHRRYIEYRVLAECLRVQAYLRYSGSRILAAEQLSWTQQEETAWVMDALCALSIGDVPHESHDIRKCWVEDQMNYHNAAGKKAKRDSDISEIVVKTALIFSVTLYIAAVIFEMLCGGLLFEPSFHIESVELCRTILKIAMGSISAATLFVANYYGRLSLPRMLSDHAKMARFYKKMSARLSQCGQTEELLTVLAREELIENGNWCSYQRDNTPDISF